MLVYKCGGIKYQFSCVFFPNSKGTEEVRIIGGSGHGAQSKGGSPKIGDFRPKSIKIDIKSGFQGRKLIFRTKEGFEVKNL